MDTPPLPKSGAASPRPPAHNGPAGRDRAAGSRRDAATGGSPPCGDSRSPRTPHPATDSSPPGSPSHTARASAPHTLVSRVVPLGCLPCLCPFMGNPISGATNLPPVTVTMARYGYLTSPVGLPTLAELLDSGARVIATRRGFIVRTPAVHGAPGMLSRALRIGGHGHADWDYRTPPHRQGIWIHPR